MLFIWNILFLFLGIGMAEFRDTFPDLAQVIDIGGDRYFMGPQKPIELGFKSRQDYLKAFGENQRTEYLLRKYMFMSSREKKKLIFDSTEDKAELIAILKRRAKQLEASKEFTSSYLKNTLIQRSYLAIQQLLQELEGAEYAGEGEAGGLVMPDILPCTKAKKYIKQIPDERLFTIILEIAWFLLHPDSVPEDIKCDWAKLVKGLDTLRLGDVIQKIKDAGGGGGGGAAFNYFKKINLDTVARAPTIENAFQAAADAATKIESDNANDNMKARVKTLLDILTMKGYISGDFKNDKERMKIIDVPETADKIKKQMIANPMTGGATKALDKSLGVAMGPLFDYFKVMFEPIYSLLESGIAQYGRGATNIKKVILPQLTTLLHICNNLNPKETTEGGFNTYGVYRITNVDSEIVAFIKSLLGSTATYVSGLPDKKAAYTFNKQLFKLPKVRLSSLINRFDTGFKNPDLIPYIQFFVVGENLIMPDEGKRAEFEEGVQVALVDFFKPEDLYIVCTDSDRISENIPMNMYQIDYDSVGVGDSAIKIENLPENYFNKNKERGHHLDGLMSLAEYIVFNDAELALSIFIALKELMPK
jgi:hypothetical protein